MPIPKEIYNIKNITLLSQLRKNGSKLFDEVSFKADRIEQFKKSISKDVTKTVAAQTLILGDMINKEIMDIIGRVDKEHADTATAVKTREDRIQKAVKFSDVTELLLATRYGDSITNKVEFLGLVKDDFEAARLALQDHLTRRKFKIKDGDGILQIAGSTAGKHVLGEGTYLSLQKDKQHLNTLQQYGSHLVETLENLEKVTNPISSNVVNF